MVMSLWPRFFASTAISSSSAIRTQTVAGILSKLMNESIWVFGTGTSFHPSYTVLKGNSGISKITVLPSGSLSQTPDLENFATAQRSSKRVINLARERWRRPERDKLDRRRSTMLTISPSSDARPL